MKRFLIIVTLLGLISSVGYGQLQFGAKAGLVTSSTNLSKEIGNDELPSSYSEYEEIEMKAKDAKAGFQAGFFGRLTILGIYVQPELMFTSTNSRVEVTKHYVDAQDPKNYIKTQTFNRVDIPLLVGGKFGPLRIQGGPVGTFMLTKKSAIEAALDDNTVNEKFNSATWGYQVGVGADIFNFLTLDIKYEGSLSKLGDKVTIGEKNYSLDNRTNQFIVTAGIFF